MFIIFIVILIVIRVNRLIVNFIRKNQLVQVIEPSDRNFVLLSHLLRDNNFLVVRSFGLSDAIQKAIDVLPDLILCNYSLPECDGYQVYNIIEKSILKNGTPFIVYFKQYDLELIQLGLEIGVDNFVFMPFNGERIIQKIKSVLKKVEEHKLFELNCFNKLFFSSPIGICITRMTKIESANSVFLKMLDFSSAAQLPPIDSLFDFESLNGSRSKLMNCLKGMCTDCEIHGISRRANPETLFDIHVVHFNKVTLNYALIQIVECKRTLTKPLNGFSNRNMFKDSNLESSQVAVHITPRELQVIDYSAKGLPIKQIASQLDISERTVEKHRSNIMRKTNTSNIIEAIRAIYGIETSDV